MRAESRTASQLDPFAFPSETKGRFLMLIVVALTMGVYQGSILLSLPGGIVGLRRELHEIAVGIKEEFEILGASMDPAHVQPGEAAAVLIRMFELDSRKLVRLSESRTEFSWRILIYRLHRILIQAGSMLLLAAVAFGIYRHHPQRIRGRHGTKLLSREEAPRVIAEIEDLCFQNGLALPRIEVRPGLAQGHAFGLRGREVLLLHGDPKLLESSWGESLRVIALHEMGHIANGDAQEREKARAVWLAFLALLVAMVLLVRLVLGVWPTGRFAVMFMVVTTAIWMIRAGLIRIRELYADWRVASWGAGAALENVLALPEREPAWWERSGWWWRAWERWGECSWWRGFGHVGERLWRGWRRLWQAHPLAQARREVLEDSSRLFGIPADLPFLTGFLLTLILVTSFGFLWDLLMAVLAVAFLISSAVLSFAAGLVPGSGRDVLIALTAGIHVTLPFLTATGFLFFLSFFLTRTLGAQVQRRAVANLVTARSRGWGYARLLGPALLLALGMEAGFWLAPGSAFGPGGAPSMLTALPLWLLGFTILAWLWLAYTHALSRFLLGSHASRANPRWRRSLVTVASVSLLAILFWPAALARLAILIALRFGGAPLLDPSFLPALTVLMLVFAIVVYAFCAGFSLLLIWIGVLRYQLRCPVCNEVTQFRIVLGRVCQGCGGNLSPWAFLRSEAFREGGEEESW